MRRVSIVVTCDCCGSEVEEDNEGDSAIVFTVRGEQREMDLCGECVSGSFLQEARPVINRRERAKAKDFVCHCGKAFTTQRGLSHHQTRAHDGDV